MDDQQCFFCKNWTPTHPDQEWVVCRACAQGIPAALQKAAVDYFDYALGLETGEVIFFHQATVNGRWVHLDVGDAASINGCDNRFPFERGVDVRLDRIVWVADAPFGS